MPNSARLKMKVMYMAKKCSNKTNKNQRANPRTSLLVLIFPSVYVIAFIDIQNHYVPNSKIQ